jgi:steroid 5-alpha reductase family enzyme
MEPLTLIHPMTKLFLLINIFSWFSGGDVNIENLLGSWIIIMLTAALLCFLVSEITRNYSQVDKLWSLMPIIYSLLTLIAFPSPRLWIMSLLVIIWGFRLSYNFYRKGGYNLIPWKGEEDYRWKIMRQHTQLNGRIRFGLFNLLFISFYQHFLILLFSTPLLLAAGNQDSSLTILDITAAVLMLLFICIETIADNQQFRFQKLKRGAGAPETHYSKSLKDGFLSEGLWHFVRHPNFVSEQAIWISFYLFGVAASGEWINWTLAGSLLLILLFQGSTALTERISSDKYPGYAIYKKEVPKFFPRLYMSGKQ